MSVGAVRITDFDFLDDALIFAKTIEVISEALESLSERAEPLGLRVSWNKTKAQTFGDKLVATIESVLVGGENVEVTQTFTYLGSVIHSSIGWKSGVNRRRG